MGGKHVWARTKVAVAVTSVLLALDQPGSAHLGPGFQSDDPSTSSPASSGAEAPRSSLDGEFVPEELLVTFWAPTDEKAATRFAARYGAHLKGQIRELRLWRFSVPPGTEKQIQESMSQDDLVERAEVSYISHASATPNDPQWNAQPGQWGAKRISAHSGWDVYPGTFAGQGNNATGVPIGVIDTGINPNHEDLSDGRVDAANFADCITNHGEDQPICVTSPAYDNNGHGTLMAGLIGAATNNLVGIAGIAYNSRIQAVKALDSQGRGTSESIAAGILWAVQHGAKVLNLSFSSQGGGVVCSAIATAISSYGATVIASSGDNYFFGLLYPAACPGVIAVGGVDEQERIASDGSTGVWTVAPSTNIVSTEIGGGYSYTSGTSNASAFVSGVAGLILSESGGMATSEEVARALAQGADKVYNYSGSLNNEGWYTYGPSGDELDCSPGCDTKSAFYGYGRLNAANTISIARSPDFWLRRPSSPAPVFPGDTMSVSLRVNHTWSFNSPIALSVEGLPEGATWFAAQDPGDPWIWNISITTDPRTPAGESYPYTVVGTSGSTTRRTNQWFQVKKPFDPIPTPGLVWGLVGSGFDTSVTVSTAPYTGFSGPISLTSENLPGGIEVTYSPNPSQDQVTSTMNLSVASSVPIGRYSIPIQASGGTSIVSRVLDMWVVPPHHQTTINYSPSSGQFVYEGGPCTEAQLCVPLSPWDTQIKQIDISDMLNGSGGFTSLFMDFQGRSGPYNQEQTIKTLELCGSAQNLAIPPGADRIVFYSNQLTSAYGCGPLGSPSTSGWVTITFDSTDPTFRVDRQAYYAMTGDNFNMSCLDGHWGGVCLDVGGSDASVTISVEDVSNRPVGFRWYFFDAGLIGISSKDVCGPSTNLAIPQGAVRLKVVMHVSNAFSSCTLRTSPATSGFVTATFNLR